MKLSRLILLLAFAACINPLHSKAQWRIGPSLGLNISKITESSAPSQGLSIRDIDGVSALRAGCLVEYAPGLKISFQSGLFYSGMGADYKIYDTNYGISTGVVKTRLNYLSVPLEAHYILKNNTAKMTVFAGADLNFLAFGTTNSDDDSDSYAFFDPTIKLGAQVILSQGFGVKLDYGLGTANTFKEVYRGFFYDPIELDSKNRTLGISVFWLFGGSGII